jgi:hypothetical protein
MIRKEIRRCVVFPVFPTAHNTEVIPCLIVVDQSGLDVGAFQSALDILQNIIKTHSDKLRIGLIMVGNTITPNQPENVRFLAPVDWGTPKLPAPAVLPPGRFLLAKAILTGLWAMRIFANTARSEGLRVFPPLIYVLTRRLPQDDPETTSKIAAYTKKATEYRRLVMKWFYLPDDAQRTSIDELQQFVAQPDVDIHLLNVNDVISRDKVQSSVVHYISQSINSFIVSLSLPHPPSDFQDEEDELAILMEQTKFKP